MGEGGKWEPFLSWVGWENEVSALNVLQSMLAQKLALLAHTPSASTLNVREGVREMCADYRRGAFGLFRGVG